MERNGCQEEKQESVGSQKPREGCLLKESTTSYATGHMEGGLRTGHSLATMIRAVLMEGQVQKPD